MCTLLQSMLSLSLQSLDQILAQVTIMAEYRIEIYTSNETTIGIKISSQQSSNGLDRCNTCSLSRLASLGSDLIGTTTAG